MGLRSPRAPEAVLGQGTAVTPPLNKDTKSPRCAQDRAFSPSQMGNRVRNTKYLPPSNPTEVTVLEPTQKARWAPHAGPACLALGSPSGSITRTLEICQAGPFAPASTPRCSKDSSNSKSLPGTPGVPCGCS